MGSRRGKEGGGGCPFVPDAGCSHIYHYGNKSPPPHVGCLGDGNRAGSSSRHPQRAMGEGAGRERTPLCPHPPATNLLPAPLFWALFAGRDRVSAGNNAGASVPPSAQGAEDRLVPSLVH